MKLEIAASMVEVVQLPAIFRLLRDSHADAEPGFADKLLATVKVYNYVAPESEAAWREVLAREYQAWCERESK